MFSTIRMRHILASFICISAILTPAAQGQPATRKKPTVHKAAPHPAAKVATKNGSGKASTATVINPNAFIPYFNQGRIAYLAEHYLEAEKQLKQAYKLAEPWATQNPTGFQQKNLALVAQVTGSNAYQLKKYKEAEFYLKQALSIYSRPAYALSNQDAIMRSNLILGQMAMYDGRFLEAEDYYKIALPLQEKRLGADHTQTQQTQQILRDIAQIDYGPDYLSAMGKKVTHWTHPEEPIAIYIEDGSSIPGWNPQDRDLVVLAYSEWQQAMEDRVHFMLVTDPQEADTIVSWMERPKTAEQTTDLASKPELHHGECQTQMMDNKWVKDNLVIALNNRDGKAFNANTIQNTLLHEIAHSLGLLGGHSPNPSDILFPSSKYDDGRQKHLTQRDIATARKLYSYPAEITNPARIHLVRYQRYANLRLAGGNAYNQKDFQTAMNALRAALSVYNQEPEAHFLLGVSAYQLKAYGEALQPLMNAAANPNRYQDEALKMVGYTLIKLGEGDEQAGATYLAEQKYQQAYKLLSQGVQSIAIKPENQKPIHEEMNWLNLRLSMNPSSVIQWEAANPATAEKQAFAKKKRGWFSKFAASFIPYVVPSATSN